LVPPAAVQYTHSTTLHIMQEYLQDIPGCI